MLTLSWLNWKPCFLPYARRRHETNYCHLAASGKIQNVDNQNIFKLRKVEN